MKLFVFILLLTILYCFCNSINALGNNINSNLKPESYYQDQFREWMRKNNKEYSVEEFKRKYVTFKENLIWINDFNKDSCGCDHENMPKTPKPEENTQMQMGLNSFSDLTSSEFADLILQSDDYHLSDPAPAEIEPEEEPPKEEGCSACKSSSGRGLLGGLLNRIFGGSKMVEKTEMIDQITETFPNSVDLTHLTPYVRNQGQCGSCYAFATVATLEAALTKKNKKQYDLSEQQLVDCSANHGCKGGSAHNCFLYIYNNGLSTEGNYTYKAEKLECKKNITDKTGHISNFFKINRGNEAGITRALVNHGPVSVAFFAGSKKFQFYSGGILSDDECPKNKTNHIVAVVGYGVEHGIKFFKLKNSWGTGWGENGFFRMKRDVNTCGINLAPAYPIL